MRDNKLEIWTYRWKQSNHPAPPSYLPVGSLQKIRGGDKALVYLRPARKKDSCVDIKKYILKYEKMEI
jgi:hypothetical protein